MVAFTHDRKDHVKALSACCKYCVVFSSKPGIFVLDNCSRPEIKGYFRPGVEVPRSVKMVQVFFTLPTWAFAHQYLPVALLYLKNMRTDYQLLANVINQSSETPAKFYKKLTNWRTDVVQIQQQTPQTLLKSNLESMSFHSDFVTCLVDFASIDPRPVEAPKHQKKEVLRIEQEMYAVKS